MSLKIAWLLFILQFIAAEFQTLLGLFRKGELVQTVGGFLLTWADPRGKGGWQLFRRVSWLVTLGYLCYASVLRITG